MKRMEEKRFVTCRLSDIDSIGAEARQVQTHQSRANPDQKPAVFQG